MITVTPLIVTTTLSQLFYTSLISEKSFTIYYEHYLLKMLLLFALPTVENRRVKWNNWQCSCWLVSWWLGKVVSVVYEQVLVWCLHFLRTRVIVFQTTTAPCIFSQLVLLFKLHYRNKPSSSSMRFSYLFPQSLTEISLDKLNILLQR